MSVDKFGRSGKSNSVITKGVSLSYIGNNSKKRWNKHSKRFHKHDWEYTYKCQ